MTEEVETYIKAKVQEKLDNWTPIEVDRFPHITFVVDMDMSNRGMTEVSMEGFFKHERVAALHLRIFEPGEEPYYGEGYWLEQWCYRDERFSGQGLYTSMLHTMFHFMKKNTKDFIGIVSTYMNPSGMERSDEADEFWRKLEIKSPHVEVINDDYQWCDYLYQENETNN